MRILVNMDKLKQTVLQVGLYGKETQVVTGIQWSCYIASGWRDLILSRWLSRVLICELGKAQKRPNFDVKSEITPFRIAQR